MWTSLSAATARDHKRAQDCSLDPVTDPIAGLRCRGRSVVSSLLRTVASSATVDQGLPFQLKPGFLVHTTVTIRFLGRETNHSLLRLSRVGVRGSHTLTLSPTISVQLRGPLRTASLHDSCSGFPGEQLSRHTQGCLGILRFTLPPTNQALTRSPFGVSCRPPDMCITQ